MKKMILLLLSMSTATAFSACPDLRGSFQVCKFKNGRPSLNQEVVIEQNEINGVTHYSISSMDLLEEEKTTLLFIADGQPRPIVDEDFTGEIKVTCANNKLIISETLVENEGLKLYSIESYSKDDIKLIKESTLDWSQVGGGVKQYLETCE